MSRISRRRFLQAGVGAAAASVLEGGPAFSGSRGQAAAPGGAGALCVVASGNGLRATEKAMELMRQGADPLDAVIAGVNIVEEDPNDMSVGYGGLPNEEGVVELDASVMYGPTHKAGAVAALRNIKTPSKVAKLVMERTAHVLLVGEGALKFARAHGFKEEDLLTDKAREVWLKWKESLSDRDYWLSTDDKKITAEIRPYIEHYGTINCLAINSRGSLAGVTTTSGYAFKLPGRVGDSPIIGAGLYVDNAVGAAGSTGFGEANLRTCASFQIVHLMGQGFSPEEACLKAMQAVADKSMLQPRLLSDDGRPNFGHSFYALNKKGEFGSANMWSGGRFAVHDGKENKFREAAYLYKRNKER
ncbi:MAG: asparaginase [Candidatus Aminicenantes bacterium RBG_16_63_16]|nr:MAG: asparaginase [Candidatus Aminicenantes bacterium RBG_16_63_16]